MRRRIPLPTALALLGLLATPAAAEIGPEVPSAAPESVDWSEWTPSFALGITILNQDTVATTYGRWHALGSGASDTSFFDNDCNDALPEQPRCRWITELGDGTPLPVQDGQVFYKHDHFDGAAIPLSFELMTPSFLPKLAGRPRLFGEVGYQFPREPRFQAARASSGVETGLPTTPDLPRMELDVKMKRMWSTGVGVAFQTEIGGFPIQIRPSLNYFGQQAEFLMTASSPGVDASLSKTEVYHGLGPKLGFDVEMGRRGPLSFHLLLATYLAWFPSGLEFEQKGVVTGPPPGPGGNPPYTPDPLGNDTYGFRFDNLQPGGSVLLRVSWEGFSE